jgi:oligopeptide transport system substrate-binding protein
LSGIKGKTSVLILALLVVALAITVAACGGSSTTASESPVASPVAGGTLNYPINAEPGGITAWTVYESEGWQVVHNTEEGLVQYVLQSDGSMKTMPNIAESWDSPDGKVWTFKLKQNVTFAPPVNRAVTAQDFADSWNFNTDPNLGTNYTTYVLEPIEGTDSSGYRTGATLTGVKVIDDYTLQVTLKYPFFDFPVTLGHPVAYVEPVDYIKKIGIKKFTEKPVGTGPYMVDKWVHNQSVDLVKNPSWWQSGTGNGAFLDAVHMPIYLNSNTEWLDFQKGTIDWSSVPPGQVNAALNNPKVKDGTWSANKWPNLGIYYVNINYLDPVVGGASGLPLRQALSYSADTNAIINVINEGVPVAANGLVPVGIPGSDLSTLPYPYDLNKAKELVAQIGTVPTLNYWFNTDLGHQKIAEALQAGWKQAGINVKLSNFEWNTFNKMQREHVKGDQLSRSGWLADYPSMDNFLFPLYQSDQQGLNGYSFYKNPEVDQLFAQARSTSDETQRLNLYAQGEKIILDDAVTIPLYFYRNFRVWNSTRVQGMVMDPLQAVNFWQAWVAQ